MDAIHVTQLERDTVLVCLDRECLLGRRQRVFLLRLTCFSSPLPPSAENLKIVNLQGRLKSNKKLASELSFDFCIESVGEDTPGGPAQARVDPLRLTSAL